MLIINLAIIRNNPQYYTLKFKQKVVELSYAKGNVKNFGEYYPPIKIPIRYWYWPLQTYISMLAINNYHYKQELDHF